MEKATATFIMNMLSTWLRINQVIVPELDAMKRMLPQIIEKAPSASEGGRDGSRVEGLLLYKVM